MGTYKLLLDDTIRFDFTLIGIHCSLEEYHLAFLLNKHLNTHLSRCREDLAIAYDDLCLTFPLYEYQDSRNYLEYHLVSNKVRTEISALSGGLFESEKDATGLYHVLPEYKRVDYFLRVYEEGHAFAKAHTLASLNNIPQIITAYAIDVQTLKMKENLIFE